jgi:4-amino-4-deoxy-L-arabinose transferase-like glycosyltransferase
MTYKKNRVVFILLALMIVGFIIRLYHLDWQCLTVDERVTFVVANRTAESIFFWSLGSDYNPPFYYILAHLSSVFFGGVSVYTIRIPALFFGVLTIPSIYFLGRELDNRFLGLLAAGITTFFFPFVYYSQNARPYTLIMFVFCIYMVFFIRIYRGGVTPKNLIFLSIFGALCLWSHFYSIIPIAVSMIILMRKNQKLIYLCGCGILLLCIPFLRYVPTVINHISYLPHFVHNEFWATPIQMAIMIPNELFCWSWIIVVPLIIITFYRYQDPLHRDLLIIASVTALSCIPMTALTAMLPRYALLVSPIFLVIALYPLSKVLERQNTLGKICVGYIGILFIFFVFNCYSLVSWFTFNICQLLVYV